MRGKLSEFSVADLLQLYQIAGKSGRLTVWNEAVGVDGEHRGRTHTFYFDRGLVNGAGADQWHLMTELQRIELLPEDVREQLAALEDDESQAGLGLIARALLTPPAWDQFVDLQIEQLIYTPLAWRQGDFEAEVDAHPRIAPLRIKQAPQQLILNAARWEEEIRRAETDGIDRDGWWQRTDASADVTNGEQDPLLTLLAQPRTLADLASAAGIGRLPLIDRLRSLNARRLVEQHHPVSPEVSTGT